MPLELSNSQSVEVKTVNAYEITHIIIGVKVGIITVKYDIGSLSNGVLTKISAGSEDFEDADFLAMAGSQVTQGSLYDNIKVVAYGKLMERLGVSGNVI